MIPVTVTVEYGIKTPYALSPKLLSGKVRFHCVGASPVFLNALLRVNVADTSICVLAVYDAGKLMVTAGDEVVIVCVGIGIVLLGFDPISIIPL